VSPSDKPHAAAQLELAAEFRDAERPSELAVEAFAPVSTRLDRHNAPEPDIVVAAITDDPFVPREAALLAVGIFASSLSLRPRRKGDVFTRVTVYRNIGWWTSLVGG
jgi:uncharacterized protein (UPF0264 family)